MKIDSGVLKEARPSPRMAEKGGSGGWMVEVAQACQHVTCQDEEMAAMENDGIYGRWAVA